MEMVLLITVREAVSLLHRTPAFSNILNEVYSERSCLICVLNNKETVSLRHSKRKYSFQVDEFQQKYKIENGEMTDSYWMKLI